MGAIAEPIAAMRERGEARGELHAASAEPRVAIAEPVPPTREWVPHEI